MATNIITDESYNIKELEVDPSWIKDLGPDYMEYRKRWDMACKGHLFDFPLFMEVEISYACNYRCPKCPRQAIDHTRKSGFMSTELLDKLFDEVGKNKMPSITFSHGGEPLMRKDMPELIRKAKKAGILDRMFHTNGMLLTKDLSVELIASGLTKINFSIDAASPKTYKKLRVGGDYDTVISHIENFLKVRRAAGKSYPRVRVSFVVSEENKHEQKKFYEFWKDKVNLISFQRYYDFSEISSEKEGSSACPDIKHLCTQLFQLLTISYTGDILICERDYGHKHVLGNLKTHTIRECWHSETMNKFRALHKENRWGEIPLCRKCVARVYRDITYAV